MQPDVTPKNKLGFPKEKFVYIDEDPYIAVHMMSMCDKHILSNSTLSFWGAYLDKKQENPSNFDLTTYCRHHCEQIIFFKIFYGLEG